MKDTPWKKPESTPSDRTHFDPVRAKFNAQSKEGPLHQSSLTENAEIFKGLDDVGKNVSDLSSTLKLSSGQEKEGTAKEKPEEPHQEQVKKALHPTSEESARSNGTQPPEKELQESDQKKPPEWFKGLDDVARDVGDLSSTLRRPGTQGREGNEKARESHAERLKQALQRVNETSAQTNASFGRIQQIETEIQLMDQQKPQIQEMVKYTKSLLESIDLQSESYAAHQQNYDQRRVFLQSTHTYASQRLLDTEEKRGKLIDEKAALNSGYPELYNQFTKANNDYLSILGEKKPVEWAITETRLRQTYERITEGEKKLYIALKDYNAIQKELQEHMPDFQKERDLTAQRQEIRRTKPDGRNAKDVTVQLRGLFQKRLDLNQRNARAEQNVERLFNERNQITNEYNQLRGQALLQPEMQPVLQKIDVKMTDSGILWNTAFRHYEAHRYIDRTTRQMNELGRMEQAYRDHQLMPPTINALDSAYNQWNTFSNYKEKVDEKHTHLVFMHQSYAEIVDTIPKYMDVLTQNEMLGTQVDASQQAIKTEIDAMQKDFSNLRRTMDEKLSLAQGKLGQTQERRETFEKGELTEANKKLQELAAKLGQDHLYFSWYERTEYNSEAEGRQSLNTQMRSACVVAAMTSRMSDYPETAQFNSQKISSKLVASAIGYRAGFGAYIRNIPDAFQKLGVPEPYRVVDMRVLPQQSFKARRLQHIAALEKVTEYAPAIVSIYNRNVNVSHALIVDKIYQDTDTGSKYVCLRDVIGGLHGKGSSYKVRLSAFQAVWDPSQVIVPTKSLSLLGGNTLRKEKKR